MATADLSTVLMQTALVLALAVLGHGIVQRAVPKAFRVALRRRRRLESPEELAKREATLSHVVLWGAEGLILVTVVLTILAQFSINIFPAVASLGVLGIAVGLGAQALVRDVISGLFILVEDQYRVGDIVRVAAITGTVEEVNLRRTILRDMDGVVHSVPNGEVRIASNMTRDLGRLNLDFPVSYGADLDRLREVVDAVGAELAGDPTYGPLITDPPRMLRVEGFDEQGVLIKVTGVTRAGRHWEVAGEFRRRLLAALPAGGIGLPYSPRTDLPARASAPDTAAPGGPSREAAVAPAPGAAPPAESQPAGESRERDRNDVS